MPRMTCWCDRYWWLLEECRFPGVSKEAHPMPFHCPFDHLYDLEKWVHSDVPMRECVSYSAAGRAEKKPSARTVAGLSDAPMRESVPAFNRAVPFPMRASLFGKPRVRAAHRSDVAHLRVDPPPPPHFSPFTQLFLPPQVLLFGEPQSACS